MTVAFEYPHRVPSMPMTPQAMMLEDRFEVIKDIGDGSFGSVALARVRTAGAHIAKRGTMVCWNSSCPFRSF
jgi:meiosis induction protein kinase IME2/SME1